MTIQRLMEFIKKKRGLSLLIAAVATFGTILVSYAINRTTTEPTYNGGSIHTFPASLDADRVMQGFDGTGSGIPTVSPPPILLADSSPVTQGSGVTPFTEFADNSDDDSDDDSSATQNTKGGDVGQGSPGMNPEGYSDPNDGSLSILLAENQYPTHDYDLMANLDLGANSNVQASGGPASPPQPQPPEKPETPAPDNKPTSHTPEPSAMLLLGSGLIGLAAFGRKLRKR